MISKIASFAAAALIVLAIAMPASAGILPNGSKLNGSEVNGVDRQTPVSGAPLLAIELPQ